MKMNNHVPHRLKKRTLKRVWKFGSATFKRNQPSYRYYELMDLMKNLNPEAYRHLKSRLFIRHALNSGIHHFKGRILDDFVWHRTPQGSRFWGMAEDLAYEYFKEKDSEELNRNF
ncbi:hypothetical protein Aci011_003 [Acinetobacter phage vB_AbaM_B09_Aci01-1]|uniref:Uncharacterized protein n=3 Tax=Saclayvirus TaxID=2733128 RepID=A0A386KLF8_9CAUD|nr:hypothetical protein HOU29_gp003 [Acinetobacter phage vB_AbaM_B09_Aci01-1]YP_009813225.1 hypothetical protein HOU30_gp003 [Acinetobacter phage vB_AbaM_B09_Aci02-2]YP_009813857.1 hypothetical protein HOU35_gp003 [Acinetobacter phage vB_AbaM_B09_Aci05]AYD82402.1 hypothetical protein Aci05_003 [Acinetobacter phage vB_AbaM_B09_Aci05]AYD85618.1 hypothetical protein Aci011_003 [Acinetobacter phage vB_AbaM_B09_Aci01-1]AYD85779.1 hypothetical protein Aci022_003 [Acinetobacter phage vB_AbaM_B09_Aci0